VNRIAAAVIGAMALIASGRPAAAEASVTELSLRDGGMQRVLFVAPANPRAVLIMLPGGNGMVEFGPDGAFRRMGSSFLLRTLPLWREQGFATAVLSSPNGMSLLGYRHTPAYAEAVGQAVDFVRSRVNRPVWLIGTSQGATAAVAAAARLGGRVAGIVVMSSVTGRSSAGETLFDSEPGRVAVPVLIVGNTRDTCPASPPDAAARIAETLTQAPRKEILYLESADLKGQPCGAESPHGYFGIERETVERVAERIGSMSMP
jgi:pimeloyl-ACP methyl ester carboxylesterase